MIPFTEFQFFLQGIQIEYFCFFMLLLRTDCTHLYNQIISEFRAFFRSQYHYLYTS